MPNQKPNKNEPSIDAQIDQLVNSMSEATEKLAEEIEQAAQEDEQFEIEALHSSAVQAKGAVSEVEPSPTEPAPSLDDQVEEMLEDASASAPPAKPTVDAVDEELAELADEMLEGDFDDADAVLSASESAPPKPKPIAQPDPEATLSAAPPVEMKDPDASSSIDEEDLLEGDFDDADEVIAQGEPEPPKAKPVPAPAPAPKAEAPKPAPEPAHAKPKAKEPEPELEESVAEEQHAPEDRTVTHSKPAKPRKERHRRETGDQGRLRALAHGAGGAAYRVAEIINKPLDTKPAKAKDVAGWLAAVTLFNALAVWFFLFFMRGPAPGTSAEPAVELVGQPTPAIVDEIE